MTIKEIILGRNVYAQAGNRPNYTISISVGDFGEKTATYFNNGSIIGRKKFVARYTESEIRSEFEFEKLNFGFTFDGQKYPAEKDFDSSNNTNTGGSGQTTNTGGVGGTSTGQSACDLQLKYSTRSKDTGKCECVNGQAKNADGTPKNECIVNKAGSVGIKCTAQDLINNTCSRNINKTLGIRSSDTTPNPTLLLQDVVLGATSFVGTIIMVALVYLGFKAILKGTDDADALGDIKGKAKNLIIGFLLVIGSYTIIRLVQYIARGF